VATPDKSRRKKEIFWKKVLPAPNLLLPAGNF